ncbi:hypothetical protein CEXT_445191 [Caerostris extrusa]|uniref:Uncharacterized protein n=1 Tax=Caerostris extrusa TaxID=172846 RepID=A0AAV4XGT6_CAEEX|nr:hypothetical protein CEXT_445191 [Caerostris extrusa]
MNSTELREVLCVLSPFTFVSQRLKSKLADFGIDDDLTEQSPPTDNHYQLTRDTTRGKNSICPALNQSMILSNCKPPYGRLEFKSHGFEMCHGFSLRKDAEALIRGDKKASASTWWTFKCEDVSFVLMSYRTM